MNNMVVLKLNVGTVLMDVDGTMTVEKGSVPYESIFEDFVDLVMKYQHLGTADAEKAVEAAGGIKTTCCFRVCSKFDIPRSALWNSLRKKFERVLEIPEDTIFFFNYLKKRNIRLYSATTNSEMMTLLKLSVGGLADIDGSSYFAGFYGGDIFNNPEGKFSPDFFSSIMKHGAFAPDHTIMIGDDVDRDMKPALKAGLKNAVIVDRKQKESLALRDGGIFVNSLRIISEII